VIEVLGVPFDLCGKRMGSRMGPDAVRLGGLNATLAAMGMDVRDAGDVEVCERPVEPAGLRNFGPAFETLLSTKEAVRAALRSGRMPMVVGGEHSISIGTVSGALSALGSNLAVLWIDAHADLNTPGTSPSGNLHGMPLGALMGYPSGVKSLADRQWRSLLSKVVPAKRLQPNRVAWLGLREVDEGERERLSLVSGHFVATMYDIDRFGLVECVSRLDQWLRGSGAKALWISFDVDALDPILAPGTGTAVRGGITYREMHLIGEMLQETLAAPECPYSLAGMDLVEINPLYDSHNETARTVVEWIASLFGKTILGKR